MMAWMILKKSILVSFSIWVSAQMKTQNMCQDEK